MTPNKAQLAFMARNGIASMEALHKAPAGIRLEWANLARRPDPEPEATAPTHRRAVVDFLNGRAPESLTDPGERDMLRYLETSPHFADKAEATTAADIAQSIAAPQSRGIPALDVAKINAAGLSGPARLDIANDFDMLIAARAGRFTADEDKILTRLNPYLQSAA